MSQLPLLRRLAEYQQYPELNQAAQDFWDETNHLEALPLLALAQVHLGQHESAQTFLKQAQHHQAEYSADSLVEIAGVLIVLQRIDEAQSLLLNVVEQYSEHALAAARLGYCYTLQQQYDLAATQLEKATALAPSRIPIVVNLAGIYLMQSRAAEAQQVLEAGSKSQQENQSDYPDFVITQNQQLLDLMQLRLWVVEQQFSTAEHWLESLIETQPIQTQLYWVEQYARLLSEEDHHAQASEILYEYVKGNPVDGNVLCLPLAELALLQGQFMQAINVLRKAIKQDKENVTLWVRLSNACLHRVDKQARAAAEKAVTFSQDLQETEALSASAIAMQQAHAKNALAQVESHEQNFRVAETLFTEILTQHENFLPALQGLGQQKMQQGDIAKAHELFERVKAIDPVKGYGALIHARQFPDDTATLSKLEKSATIPGIEGKTRASLLFQLASAWQKLENYDKAFELAEKANTAARKFLPYDGKTHRNKCYRSRVRFSKSLYENRQDSGISSTVPVYVVGMPRSGTTLVEQVLAGHSKIFGAGELGLIPQIIQGLNRWERHTGSGRKYPDCVDDISSYELAGIANNILTELQEYDGDAQHVIDKLPHNFQNIGLIKLLFPEAKIISVRRDPRDIAMSNYFTDYQAKFGGMGFAYDLEDIGEQLADHNLMMHHWQKIFPGEILEVNYEDVVDDLEGSARRMLDYIGVEWESTVLKFNELDRTVKTASVWQVRQPIYSTSKAKWQRYEQYLAPLIKGTNAKILPDPITDMITLPEPSFQTDGVALYNAGKLDEAERNFKMMLHHNPYHAASHYLLGIVYLTKQHPQAGITEIEKALEACPWQKQWQDTLIKAYESIGNETKAEALRQKSTKTTNTLETDENAFQGSSLSSVA